MSLISVRECPAGPEINAAVAWTRGDNITLDGNELTYHPCAARNYSTDIAAAWELVEEADMFTNRFLTKNEDGKYTICLQYVSLGEWPAYYAGADENVALVICRAFLLARGIETVEI